MTRCPPLLSRRALRATLLALCALVPFAASPALAQTNGELGGVRTFPEQARRGWGVHQSDYCFVFLLAVGIPLAGLLVLGLRRASPLQPRLVASVGALGVAGLAAFILQFFHPFDVTVMDLGTHLAALALLVAAISLSGRLTLRTR